jgi:hypothetical protein
MGLRRLARVAVGLALFTFSIPFVVLSRARRKRRVVAVDVETHTVQPGVFRPHLTLVPYDDNDPGVDVETHTVQPGVFRPHLTLVPYDDNDPGVDVDAEPERVSQSDAETPEEAERRIWGNVEWHPCPRCDRSGIIAGPNECEIVPCPACLGHGEVRW